MPPAKRFKHQRDHTPRSTNFTPNVASINRLKDQTMSIEAIA
jgi:hypothetical protein